MQTIYGADEILNSDFFVDPPILGFFASGVLVLGVGSCKGVTFPLTRFVGCGVAHALGGVTLVWVCIAANTAALRCLPFSKASLATFRDYMRLLKTIKGFEPSLIQLR